MTVLDGDWQPRTLSYKKSDLNALELLADRSFPRYFGDQPVEINHFQSNALDLVSQVPADPIDRLGLKQRRAPRRACVDCGDGGIDLW
jgi:hypothetical protein